MTNRNIHASVACLILLGGGPVAVSEPVRIVGTLRDANGFSLSGKITVVQEKPHLEFTTHDVDKSGTFKFTSDSEGPVVLHAVAEDHPPVEHVIEAGTIGTVTVDFSLPLGQDVQVKVVDSEDNPVGGAELRVRYHEPEKPMRRVSFERSERTDEDGRFLLQDVGILVPFVVDVVAPNYVPTSSKLTKLAAGSTQMDDIVLGTPGATVAVTLLVAGRKGRVPSPRYVGHVAGRSGRVGGRGPRLLVALSSLPATSIDLV